MAARANLHLESHFHERFAEVRSSSDSLRYLGEGVHRNAELESFCSVTNEERAPLLLLGEFGVGASSLLANWVSRRKRSRRGSTSTNEYVFWHAVGCTRESTRVEAMLRRLMNELKHHFKLTREVPQRDDRLSWELPSFLEQAAKRGNVVLIIDGIHLLSSESSGETGLTWLPLSTPSNVRIVLSVSSRIPLPMAYSKQDILTEDMLFTRRPRFISELNRRQWLLLRLRPPDLTFARTFVAEFCRGTVLKSEDPHDPFITSLVEETEAITTDGLLLFPSQVEDVLRHPKVTSPLFLRTLLECVAWAAEHGFCVWSTLQNWLSSPDYGSLVSQVIRSFETGHFSDEDSMARARSLTQSAGGRHTLGMLYPWHPHFQTDDEGREISISSNEEADMESSKAMSTQIDADDRLEGIPSYLLGGASFEGLGKALGNALALLYVSYCGLKESELWSMLLKLREKETFPEPDVERIVREHQLIFKTFQKRGELEDVWRTMDFNHRGIISKKQFLAGLRKIDPGITRADVDFLLEAVQFNSRAPQVNYIEFMRGLHVKDRKLRVSENLSRISPIQKAEETDSFASGNESLGPLTETSLLTALTSIGILRSTEFSTLTFPQDDPLLREVVLKELIIPRGGLEFWHSVLVNHFMKLPSSLRRSEELPFHLDSTCKWYALRDLLSDLRTFEIMWTSDLSKDLTRYWYLLLHGPMYTKKPSERMRRIDGDDEECRKRQSSLLLKNIEVAAKLGLSENVSKRRFLQDKVLPVGLIMSSLNDYNM